MTSPNNSLPQSNGAAAAQADRSGEQLARSLGAFSLALGIPSLIAPKTVERLIGLRPTDRSTAIMRGVGVQEVGVGAALLRKERPVDLQWSRVAGDLGHLTLLVRALASKDSNRRRVLMTIGAVAAVTAVDVVASLRLARGTATPSEDKGMKTKTAITVRRPTEDVYRYWREFENLPEFMYHLESVETLGERRSRWVAKAPAGTTVEWEAEIVEESPGEVIAWRSLEGSSVQNSGVVRFAPAPRDQGTEVIVELEYAPPGGAIGAAVAKLFGEDPDQQVRDDLRRFKQVMETGEVVLSDGTPDGTRTQRQFKQRAAQPLDDGEK